MLLFAASVLLVTPGYDFGQREHLLLIMALPYLALVHVALERQNMSPWLTAGIGIFGGIGFCLKPHFLLVPLSVEVWLLLRNLSWLPRLETVSVLLVGIV